MSGYSHESLCTSLPQTANLLSILLRAYVKAGIFKRNAFIILLSLFKVTNHGIQHIVLSWSTLTPNIKILHQKTTKLHPRHNLLWMDRQITKGCPPHNGRAPTRQLWHWFIEKYFFFWLICWFLHNISCLLHNLTILQILLMTAPPFNNQGLTKT